VRLATAAASRPLKDADCRPARADVDTEEDTAMIRMKPVGIKANGTFPTFFTGREG